MFSRFTASARRVMQRAFREAKRCQHDFVGTLHLLHGLLCDADGPAVALLRSLDARPELMLQKAELAMQALDAGMAMEQFPLSPASRRAFEAAKDQAAALTHHLIGPEHLLLGLASQHESEAAQILLAHHVTLKALREAVARLPADAFREAQVQTQHQPHGDNPSVDELERWLAPALTHDSNSSDAIDVHRAAAQWNAFAFSELEAQLRRTQMLLGIVMGYAFGFWLSGWMMGVVMAIGGFGVSLFRNSWVAAILGAACGLLITPIFHRDFAGPLTPVIMGLVGAFLGTFLGDGWRFLLAPPAPPTPHEASHEQEEAPNKDQDTPASPN